MQLGHAKKHDTFSIFERSKYPKTARRNPYVYNMNKGIEKLPLTAVEYIRSGINIPYPSTAVEASRSDT